MCIIKWWDNKIYGGIFMKKIHMIFKDSKEQLVTCEDYEIMNGMLYLIRVNMIDCIDVKNNELGKKLIIHNIDCMRSLIIDWVGWWD